MMNTALWVTAVVWFGVVGQAASEEAGGAGSACPAHLKGEAGAAYVDRTHNYCEMRWSERAAARATGGRFHDVFINLCARKCSGDLADRQAGRTLLLEGGGAAILVGGVAAAVGAAGGRPASP